MVASLKYQNKTIGIYGMGKSGYSAAKTLKKLKARVLCWDDNPKIRKKIKKLNFSLNRFWANINLIDYIVISPGIDINNCKITSYLKKNLKKIITDLDIFFVLNKNPFVISITGTNGKSTTCKIIENILKFAGYNVKVGGNIGNPVLDLKQSKQKNIFILEISSYQLQYSKLFRSQHAAILNISSDHLERHKNIKNYLAIKSKIFFAQKNSDYSYINSKDKFSNSINNIFKLKKLNSKLIKINNTEFSFLKKKINNDHFTSKGNIENLAFACKIAKILKINNNSIIKALRKFKGLPHRQEVIFRNKNFTFINDSKATSFESAMESLSIYNKIYWILGGKAKLGSAINLNKVSNKIIKAYIVGSNTAFFVNKVKKSINYKVSHNLDRAIKNIFDDIKINKIKKCTVLLSPAAASYDQYKNFEDRGDHFKTLIKKKIYEFIHD